METLATKGLFITAADQLHEQEPAPELGTQSIDNRIEAGKKYSLTQRV